MSRIAGLLDEMAEQISCSPRFHSARDSYQLRTADLASSTVRAQIVRALAAVDHVHQFRDQPRIPLVVTASGRGEKSGYTHWLGVPIELVVDGDSPTPGLCALRLIGHQVDQQLFALFPEDPQWGSETSPLLQSWRAAVTGSSAFAAVCGDGNIKQPGVLKEAFARSYAQWIVSRCESPFLQAELVKAVASGRWWEQDDFGEVAAALDQAFSAYSLFAGRGHDRDSN